MPSSYDASSRSQVAKTRRGYGLLGLGLLFPGSAQVLQGNRSLGQFALKLWICLVILVLIVVGLTVAFRTAMLGFLGNSWLLRGLAIAVFAIGAFWVLLALNTVWIARPQEMGAVRGVTFSVIALALVVGMAFGTIWVGQALWTSGEALGTIFSGGGDTKKKAGRYNILLLGSDAGPDRWGTRPDSINVISVDADTGRAVVIGLPRNLEDVPFPTSSPLHAIYPDGYWCESEECMLNAIYTLGWEHEDLYPGVDDPGMQATIEAVSEATGLALNYYVFMDMQGFVDLIDALGGLTITIHEPILLHAEEDVWLEAGENQHLNGYYTLWFARARASDSDYQRMARQRCIMAAALKQLNPANIANSFTDLAKASGKAVKTSIPASQINRLVDIALKSKALPLQSIAFTPPLIDPAEPDFDFIRSTIAATIAASEALDKPGSGSTTPSGGPDDPGDPDDQPQAPSTPNVTDDVAQVCSVG
ncbi:MAG: LCP family protein [Propionibacteriaceae bacterium]|jgi:LCP family protein required for cell wall assembly|nr:LCP family protein [Propionibacteriaceae bacterium]